MADAESFLDFLANVVERKRKELAAKRAEGAEEAEEAEGVEGVESREES